MAFSVMLTAGLPAAEDATVDLEILSVSVERSFSTGMRELVNILLCRYDNRFNESVTRKAFKQK